MRVSNRFEFDHFLGERRGDHTPPTTPGIFHHAPAEFLLTPLGFSRIHEAADRFGGFLEGRIIFIHQHLGHDRGNRFFYAAFEKFVLKSLLQGITNRTLSVRPAHIQRDFMHAFRFGGDLGASQDEPDLRAVAMADGHIPASLDHVSNMIGGLF